MRAILFCFSFLYVAGLTGQSITLSGFVEDAASGERLIGVNLYLPGTTTGTTTNTYGFYSLTLPKPADSLQLMVSYVGYAPMQFTLAGNQNLKLDIALESSSEALAEVSVTAKEIKAQKTEMSTFKLSAREVKQIPAFMGEVDVIRTIQLLPGVQGGNEGTTGFYVRGGSPDQNLILLDGVPVYNASHLFGFFSVFNADAIKNVQLTKGGFPARFSGRLSSVLEIDLKEGNMKAFHGEGSIGLISSKLTLEGPLVKDKTSFMLSGRRTYYDLFTRPFLPDDTEFGYYFADLNFKLNHNFSRKDRLYLSFYTGLDDFNIKYVENPVSGRENSFENYLRWGNYTGSLRWNHLFSDKLFGNLSATYTQYRFLVGAEEVIALSGNTAAFSFEYSSLIRDNGLRYDLDYVLNAKHTLKMGAGYTYHIFKPSVAQIRDRLNGNNIDSILNLSRPIYTNDLVVYLEDDWKVNKRLRVNLGLNYARYFLHEADYPSLQPRLSARYLLTSNWSLKGSYAYMNQFVHLLSNSGIGLPTDLWVSSTEKIKPQRSEQIALGSVRNFFNDEWELSVEGYYKWMSDLIDYKEGASFLSTADWQDNVETGGKGEMYGIEFLLRRNQGKTTGWLAYTLAYSTRQFPNLNEGFRFPYKYDRRHDISLVVNHTFSKKMDAGLTWVFGSGNAFTAPTASFFVNNRFNPLGVFEVDRFSRRNAARMPAYHRLDLGINFHKKTRWGRRTWNISIYNAYSRQNPYYLSVQEDLIAEERQVVQVSLFPIIPSVSYIFKF